MFNRRLEIQELLSLGYLFLIALGILHNAIAFYYIDINYMEYTSVLDVLISPIAIFTESYRYLIGIPLLFVFLFIIIFFQRKYYKWVLRKQRYKTDKQREKIEKALDASKSQGFKLVMICMLFVGFYIGVGLGKGAKLSKKIEGEDFKLNTHIEFQNQNEEEVYMFHKNTLYAFYIKPNDDKVYIAPIDGNIKQIIKLKKEE